MDYRFKFFVVISIVITLALAGFSYSRSGEALHHYEKTLAYKDCVTLREGRVQGNIRARHLLLIEHAVINSNIKAQNELHGYHYPPEITQLHNEPPVAVLGPITCK